MFTIVHIFNFYEHRMANGRTGRILWQREIK